MIYQFYGTNVEMPHELQHKKVDDKFVMEEQFTQQLLEEFTMMGKKYANAKHNSQKARTSAAAERWADDATNIRLFCHHRALLSGSKDRFRHSNVHVNWAVQLRENGQTKSQAKGEQGTKQNRKTSLETNSNEVQQARPPKAASDTQK